MTNGNNHSGFTLIELLVAITIFSVVMASVYAALQAGIKAYRAQEERNYTNENYREAWKQLSRDLRCTFASESNKNIVFKGEHNTDGAYEDDKVLFTAYLSSVRSKNGGLGEIEYGIDNDPLTPETGLVRTYYGFPAGKRDDRYKEKREIAPMAKSLKIEYYDGKKWKNEWDSSTFSLVNAGKTIPMKARITILFLTGKKETDEKILSFEAPIYAGEISDAK